MRTWLESFGAGALGALAMCLTMWLFTNFGITQELGVALKGSLNQHWMYPKIVWGGLWGLLFALNFIKGGIFSRSLVIALIPTLIHLFVFYPYYENAGVAGMKLGFLTPFLTFFFYWVWSLVTAISLR